MRDMPATVGARAVKRNERKVISVLFELTKRLNSGLSLNELLSAVPQAATELSGAATASLMMLDKSGRYLMCRAATGLTRREQEIAFRLGEGVAGWVAEHGAPALLRHPTADRRFKRVPNQKTSIASLLSVPLADKRGVIGALSVSSPKAGAFTETEQEALMFLATSVVKDIENAQLYRASITDPLTGAFNRQYLCQRLGLEMDRSRRYEDAFSVVVFDVDHFKRLNDTHGHAAGDRVLQELVRLIKAELRDVDDLIRCGGEEFLVLLPKTGLKGATEVAERIRATVEAASFPYEGKRLRVTLSLGVTTLGAANETEDVLLKRADALLYKAKSSGRNRVAAEDA